MKSQYKTMRSKKRLVIYLLKLSVRGEIVKTNLAQLIQDIYDETGEIFQRLIMALYLNLFLLLTVMRSVILQIKLAVVEMDLILRKGCVPQIFTNRSHLFLFLLSGNNYLRFIMFSPAIYIQFVAY